MKELSFALRAIGCLSLVIPSVVLGQQQVASNTSSASLVSSDVNEPSAVVATTSVPPAPAPTWTGKLDRWLDLDTFNYSARYRSTFDGSGARTFDQGQQRLIAHGEFKFDEQGRYGIGFHLSSGRYFNWAYADFIGGGQHQFIQNAEAKMTPYQLYILNISAYPDGFFNSGGGQIYLRQLYLKAEPVQGLELQYGGIAINHGVNSEATSYDDDGYMTGERVSLKRPQNLWLSEISYTRGYLGDIYTPNFFARGGTLADSNYWQILGRKDFGRKLSFSGDYSYTTPDSAVYHLKTIREAGLADTRRSKLIDSVRLEGYQRINGGDYIPGAFPFPHGKGYALTVSRDFSHRFNFDAGVANIDSDYGTYLGPNAQAIILGLTVNGDQFGEGKRYFVRPTVPLNSYVSMVGDFSHVYGTVGSSIDVWNNQYLTAGLVFDLKKAIFPKAKVQ